MTINDRLTNEYFDGCFNPNIEPNIELVNSIAYWNGLPVIHDKIAKKYLIVMSEEQFESLIKDSTGGKMETLEKKMRAFIIAAANNIDLIERLDEAFRLSMVDNHPQASCLWLEGPSVRMEAFEKDEDALDEAANHSLAFFVPTSWHEKVDWIWQEEDVESGTTRWCCRDEEGVAGFTRMEDVWEYVLDYLKPNWLDEADSVIKYVGNIFPEALCAGKW